MDEIFRKSGQIFIPLHAFEESSSYLTEHTLRPRYED
jgi:hypothetical protein